MSDEDTIYEDENAPLTGLRTRYWLAGVVVVTLSFLGLMLKFG